MQSIEPGIHFNACARRPMDSGLVLRTPRNDSSNWDASGVAAGLTVRRTAKNPGRPYHSSGQGSTIFQSSTPFLIFFISVVSPPLRLIQSLTVCG
jgi:hypothetical protein